MTTGVPLRLSRDRVWLYGVGLALFGLAYQLTVIIAGHIRYGIEYFHETAHNEDWANFWTAGATVGTNALLDPKKHLAWQIAHQSRPQPFVYTPGFAWFLAPFAHLTPEFSLVIDEVLMLAVLVYAGILAARLYGFEKWFAMLAILAWYPSQYAVIEGQNAPLALLLMLLAICGVASNGVWLAGLAVGALLYKPVYALGFVALLAVKQKWRELGIVGLCAGLWYFVSVAATAGDWRWPVTYARVIFGYYQADFAWNAQKAFSLPTLLLAHGMPSWIAYGAALLVLLASLPVFARVSVLEGASIAGLVGLVVSPHAWPYDGILLLPSLFYAMTHVPEPWRTRIAIASYLIALSMIFIGPIGFDPLAILVLGGTALWLYFGYRRPSPSAENAR